MMKGDDLLFGDKRGNHTNSNLELRDYIAIKAMQGVLSSDAANNSTSEQIAHWAYDAADAMIKQSNQ